MAPNTLEQIGRVVAVGDGVVEVCARSRASCERCRAGTGCGGGILGRFLDNGRGNVLATARGRECAVGERVTLRLPARALVEAAAVVYLAPLLSLLLALLGVAWLAPDLSQAQVAAVAAGGLAIGFLLARRVATRRRASVWRPTAWPTTGEGA